jgi:hypothetical protein
MKLLGTVLGFDIGTGNDDDIKMETDQKPTTTKKETDNSTSSKPTTTTTTNNKTNEQNKNVPSEQNQVMKYFFLKYLFNFLGEISRRKKKKIKAMKPTRKKILKQH